VSGIVIVGGGPAGAAAAIRLARGGLRPLVLEREAGPHDKICGEFVSTEARAHLAALGLDLAALGAAPITHVRVASGARQVQARLPFDALGLSRRRLDQALIEQARAAGAEVAAGVAARSVGCHAVETAQGALAARAILLASGKHEVRGARRAAPGAMRGAVGFKSHFRIPESQRRELAGFVEIVLFDGGYAGLQLVEGGVANLCLLVSHARFAADGRSWPRLFDALLAEPHLARRLGDAQPLTPRPLTIADVPYGFVVSPCDAPRGEYRLGDQAAVIPSFSGDGVAIALHSAQLAARAVLEGAGAAAYHARLRRDVRRQVALAAWLQRRLQGWPGRDAALAAARLWPPVLARLAAWTRLAPAALRGAGV